MQRLYRKRIIVGVGAVLLPTRAPNWFADSRIKALKSAW